jgi:hypothetical protein
VDKLFRGDANTVGKEYFTLLYSRARDTAFTSGNIRSGWSKAGLFPFNPDKVLDDIKRPQLEQHLLPTDVQPTLKSPVEVLTTPVTSEDLASLCRKFKQRSQYLDDVGKKQMQKLAHAAERAMTGRDLLFVDYQGLLEQNNEKTTRQSASSTVIGTAKVMSYDDLKEAQRKRDAREANPVRTRKTNKRSNPAPAPTRGKRSRIEEVQDGRREIEEMGLENYCSIL